MKSFLTLILIISLAVGLNANEAKTVPAEFLVKFTPGAGLKITGAEFQTNSTSFNKIFSGQIARMEKLYTTKTELRSSAWQTEVSLSGVYKIILKNPRKSKEFLENCQHLKEIEYIEPNYLGQADLVPDDPQYSTQWSLEKLEMPVVWKITQGSTQTVVAVIDTGVDYNHPDLAQNIWINHSEIPANGLDDDQNGLVDDYRGYDFSTLPQGKIADSDAMDDYGHGSHMAGIIGAIGNNHQGVAGLNWNVKIMALKALDSTGTGTIADASQAIYYAVNNNAQIINCSFGFLADSQTLKDAVSYAAQHNVLVVASAGNYNWDVKQYPAAYQEVVAVAALNKEDKKAAFSNFGSYVDLAAPGVEIFSTSLNGGYRYFSGTSQACPMVTGAAALLKAYRASASSAELLEILKNSATDITDPKGEGANLTGWDEYTGWGRVNILNALKSLGANVDYSAPTMVIISRPDGTVFDELCSIRAKIFSDYQINSQKLYFSFDSQKYQIPEKYFNSQNGELNINLYEILKDAPPVTGEHQIEISAEDIKGGSAVISLTLNFSNEFRLTQVVNFPNPVRTGGTYFSYQLTEDAAVSVKIYNSCGRLVKTLTASAGESGGQAGFNKIFWDSTDQSSRLLENDVYFYVVIARNTHGQSSVQKNRLAISI